MFKTLKKDKNGYQSSKRQLESLKTIQAAWKTDRTLVMRDICTVPLFERSKEKFVIVIFKVERIPYRHL